MDSTPIAISPPPRYRFLSEARVFTDLARMTVPLAEALLNPTRDKAESLVIVLPGFGAGDRSTAPLRAWLNRRGFDAEGWGLGRNLAGLDIEGDVIDVSDGWGLKPTDTHNGEVSVPLLADRVVASVARRAREGVPAARPSAPRPLVSKLSNRRARETGRRISLIGWSLGGYLAREAARDLPETVDRVITLGSPIVGGPKYTAAADTFRRRGQDLDWIERAIAEREARPIRQPITAIVSRTDAIVAREAAIDRYSENVEHIEVDAAHLGLAFNPTIWGHVLDALRRDEAGS